ncbi:FIST signal transduction protein [Pigmentiphaga litoralis]|uniref:Small ligand-binding sensory domain FIST n=1 Tax=Pigmentiphaga litoralis TaxID=516702 RepID=A0A7Y9IR67_9BURK|nr:FIST N-terminal domain-containing protein [Pigmentiphaga litoralis]NYE24888.1 small ligand-binding sensory domain FIST [Pigmentiphaga litoralis]NYE81498.1 small ligand-binding sensory domain FIST [Pigmentiphaga litoralis]
MTTQFPWAHATHPDWRMAASLCLAQIEHASRTETGRQATLGFLYLTDHFAEASDDILAFLRERTGITHWTGAIGVGVAAGMAEYIDEPAMAFMLADFSPDDFQVFSGKSRPPAREARTPNGRSASWTALVHADASTPDLPELLQDMAGKIAGDTLFGGVSSSRHANALIADGIFAGGLSGVVLSENIQVESRISQGCQPIGPVHRVTASAGRLLNRLDDAPALDVLLRDMGAPTEWAPSIVQGVPVAPDARKQQAASTVQMLQGTFIGFGEGDAFLRGNYPVRPLVGVDPHERALAMGAELDDADHVVFCRRDRHAAQVDLIRACTELRETIETRYGSMDRIRGALYISCLGRTGTLFGGPSAEMQLVQQQLGDVPLIGLFANGEIYGDRISWYTGVLVTFL